VVAVVSQLYHHKKGEENMNNNVKLIETILYNNCQSQRMGDFDEKTFFARHLLYRRDEMEKKRGGSERSFTFARYLPEEAQ
jgi:hypothetical protein